ncbi:unnamed protein product [Dovyalis caffra]|uniref:non-specific serine/threonine protein kinase n=1 Tax=Dovyalis caffra TaxID=77055 RepID=A0AAV1RV08_9ROSI|nr:unnamed protein product [Dovyalis caffra]
MNCFSCFQSQKSKRENGSPRHLVEPMVPETKKQKPGDGNKTAENREVDVGDIETQSFTFRELAAATKNFRQECLLGEGGFGRVYKGTLASTGQVVAVKQLDRNGLQNNKEFLGEVLTLSLLHHPNLVNLIGYCADGDQRLLVHELMTGGSLEDHLLDVGAERKPLNWFARMNIALGAAKGLEYLHEKADPPVIYRDLKPSNILLDEEFTPKLSDYGLAKLGPSGDKMHPSSRVMGTYGYCAPEYARDPKKYPDMADPLLNNQFPEKDLNQAVAIAAMCLQEESSARPLMSDVVTALSFLSMVTDMPQLNPPSEEKATNYEQQDNEVEDGSNDKDVASDGSQSKESSDNEDRAKDHDGDTSDYHDDDESSDNEDRDSDYSDQGSENIEHQLADVNGSKKFIASSMKSVDGSVSSGRRNSRRLRGFTSNSRGSHHGSDSSNGDSSLTSHPNASLHHKSSKKSMNSLSHKSSRGSILEGSTVSTSGKSSRKSQSRSNASLSLCSSLDLEDGIRSVSQNSRGSQNGSISSSVQSSRKDPHEGRARLDHVNSKESDDGSTYSS